MMNTSITENRHIFDNPEAWKIKRLDQTDTERITEKTVESMVCFEYLRNDIAIQSFLLYVEYYSLIWIWRYFVPGSSSNAADIMKMRGCVIITGKNSDLA